MDLYHYYGNDLTVSNLGDLATVSGITLGQQRILRRLLTPPGSYIWELNYGAGIGSYVGLPLDSVLLKQIQGVITQQMLLETSVAQTPPPIINLTANQNMLFCNIQYTDAPTKTLQVLSFNVS
jgi:hypothetical protein